MTKVLLYITAFAQIIPLTIGVFNYKRLSFIEAKAFMFYMCFSVCVEIIAHYLAYHHQNNFFVYNISDCVLSLFVAFMIWDQSKTIPQVIAALFLSSIIGSLFLVGFSSYNPYTYLLLYGTIVGVSMVRLRTIVKGLLSDKQKMWFYLAFLANGVMYINLYYIYYYMLKIRSQGLLPYYISFNFASSIVFAILLSISFSCRNQKKTF